MILPDHKLYELVRRGYLPGDVHIGPCSVDLRLGKQFRTLDEVQLQHFDWPCRTTLVETDRFRLPAGAFVLATTMESITVPNGYAAHVHGRSSIGRMGLQIQNAGFIDTGFEGEITLELHNQSPNDIMLKAGWRVCQLSYHCLQEHAHHPYTGKYQKQSGATASRLEQDSAVTWKEVIPPSRFCPGFEINTRASGELCRWCGLDRKDH